MPKVKKKESIADIKKDIQGKADDVAEVLEQKAEEVASDVVEVVTQVKNDKRLSRIFKKIPFGRFGVFLLAFLAVGGIATSGYFYYQYNKTQQVLGSSQSQYSELKAIVEEVSKLMDLPPEDPTVASVSDVEKLRAQPFFNRAQNGDKVLIYQSTRKAILYRPSTKKIIDVATVNLGEPSSAMGTNLTEKGSPSVSPTKVQDENMKVVIWNGTTTTGLTKKAEEDLSGKSNIEVVERDNATKRDYEENIVINLTGVGESRVEEIASTFNAKVVELPSGETAPKEGDVLVILGRAFIPATQ